MEKECKELGEFKEAGRANPGKHSARVGTGAAGEVTAYLLMEAANLPQDAMNVVTYEGGGAARAAVAGGQVDITIVGGEGTEGIREMIRPLEIGRASCRERVCKSV